uniref:IZUMO family member 4 n=1 Tax=Myotis myotis TaxID=51298 RepID=A0A7J7XGP3_MYOMY|nr:IZUMO family member 4 [Myotis myotis]
MALPLCLQLKAALARSCLHCHGNFLAFFTRHHMNLKSWLLVQWNTAVQGFLLYILISPSFVGLEPPHPITLTLDNASEC